MEIELQYGERLFVGENEGDAGFALKMQDGKTAYFYATPEQAMNICSAIVRTVHGVE